MTAQDKLRQREERERLRDRGRWIGLMAQITSFFTMVFLGISYILFILKASEHVLDVMEYRPHFYSILFVLFLNGFFILTLYFASAWYISKGTVGLTVEMMFEFFLQKLILALSIILGFICLVLILVTYVSIAKVTFDVPQVAQNVQTIRLLLVTSTFFGAFLFSLFLSVPIWRYLRRMEREYIEHMSDVG